MSKRCPTCGHEEATFTRLENVDRSVPFRWNYWKYMHDKGQSPDTFNVTEWEYSQYELWRDGKPRGGKK